MEILKNKPFGRKKDKGIKKKGSDGIQFLCDFCGNHVGLTDEECGVCGANFTVVSCPLCHYSGSPAQFKHGCPKCNDAGVIKSIKYGNGGKKQSVNVNSLAYVLLAVSAVLMYVILRGILK